MEHVLIGAVALAAHGPVRATEDVDLVPDPAAENLLRLRNLLVRLDARLASDPTRCFGSEERAALQRGEGLTLDSSLGAIDIVQRARGVPSFAQLAADAVELELLGVPVKVCSRRHLREMKLARGTHRDRGDVEDLDSID